MKQTLLLACIFALGITAYAQDEATFQTWMNTVGGTGGSLRKNLEAKNGDGITTDAKKLEEVFGKVHAYYKDKGTEDAMTLAMTAHDAYGEAAKYSAEGKLDDASASLKKAQGTCGPCHSAHREKAADGTYKMK